MHLITQKEFSENIRYWMDRSFSGDDQVGITDKDGNITLVLGFGKRNDMSYEESINLLMKDLEEDE